jgi:NADH-quinone oxidoreductase subunit N
MLADLATLAPLWIVTAVGLASLLLDVFATRGAPRAFLGYFTAAGLSMALAVVAWQFAEGGAVLTHPSLATRLAWDPYTLLACGILLGVGILTVLAAVHHLPEQRCEWGEFYALTTFSVLGMMVLAAAAELMTLFIGLEILSIAIYVLAGFKRHSPFSVEAAMKYFFLGAFATGFLLYGMAFLYGDTGTTELGAIAAWYAANPPGSFALLVLVLMTVAFGFKISAVPFHMWTPDVYEGAPTPVTGLMAAGVKTAAFVALTRVFLVVFDQPHWDALGVTWDQLFFWLAIATMSLGNLIALVQRSVKRTLAWSSIAHAGYLLIAVIVTKSPGELAGGGLFFYLLGYSFATVGAFAVIGLLGKDMEEDISFGHLAGFGYKRPLAAAAMTIFMMSLAGLPPTVGFLGKYVVFQQAIEVNADQWLPLILVAVANSVVSVYYYLKVPVSMYMREERKSLGILDSAPLTAVLALCAIAVLALGMFPGKALEWSDKAAGTLQSVAHVEPHDQLAEARPGRLQ